MNAYRAPLGDMQFLMSEVFQADKVFAAMPGQGKCSQQAAQSPESLQVSSPHTGHFAGISLLRRVNQSLGVSVLCPCTHFSADGTNHGAL